MLAHDEEAPTLLIFDLDGTLYRTETSFTPAAAQVLQAFSLRVPPDEELHAFIGEPFDVFLEWLEHLRLSIIGKSCVKCSQKLSCVS